MNLVVILKLIRGTMSSENDNVSGVTSESVTSSAKKETNSPMKGRRKISKSFKLPYLSRHKEEEPEKPDESVFRRRTSSVGPKDRRDASRKKSGSLGSYASDIQPEPRSAPSQ